MKCIAAAVEGMLPTARERRVHVPHRCTGQQAKGMDRPNGNEKGIKISELTSQSSLPSSVFIYFPALQQLSHLTFIKSFILCL